MAITNPTKLSDFNSGLLPPNVAQPIFEQARKISVVQQLCRRVPLSINGENIPVMTDRVVAGWVAEGAKKNVTQRRNTLKSMTPQKLAAIVVVSQEVVRANPGGFMTGLIPDLAESFAVAFDMAALHDAGPDGTVGGGPFATYIDQTTKTVEFGTLTAAQGGAYASLVAAMKLIVADRDAAQRPFRLTGFAFDDVAEPVLLESVDANGRPIFLDAQMPPTETAFAGATSSTRTARILGRPAVMGEGIAYDGTVGYAGDWSQAVWGQIGSINYSVSTESSVTIGGSLVSLWEQNLVAIRAETEYAFLVNDPDAFVELENVVS